MIHFPEAKPDKNIQVNFNVSKEISYWTMKYNISQEKLQQYFEKTNHSIMQVIQLIQRKEKRSAK
ncbi:MAG: hypothetical protein NVSMB63_12530 [Sediminibacterium sp.]